MKSIKKHSVKSCAINKISHFSSFKILNKIQNLLKNLKLIQGKNKRCKRLMDNISELAQSTKVVLQWIPADTGIVGNEIADQLAKERRKNISLPHICHKQRNKTSDP